MKTRHLLHGWPRATLAKLAAVALAATALTGCTSLAPDYQRPASPVPATVFDAPAGPAAETQPLAWRDLVSSAPLRELVALALENNRDLRVAALSIDRAQALYGVEQSNRFPSVAASGAGTRARTAQDLTTAGRAQFTNQFSAGVGFASYEIDFFGRVRNLNDVALQEFFRVTANQRSVQLSLVAEVMNAWLTLQADQQRLQLARDTLRSREAAFALTRRIYQLGGTSGLVLAQNQTTVDSARADVATTTSQVARDQNALRVLVGVDVPARLLPAAGAAATPALALMELPAGLSSAVLLRRPDVLAAEHSLRGTTANIGAARAAFFPSITLTANVGTASNELDRLFNAGNGTWSFVPQIRLPIFDAGRNQANLKVAEANQSVALAQYEKAVQTAFREVADALAERATLAERIDAQTSLVAATQKAFTLSEARFKAGADNYLSVLDAQRALYTAQQGLIAVQQAAQANRLTLYKVLGGG